MGESKSELLSQQYTEEKYPLEFRDKYKKEGAVIIGAGQAYRKYAEPSLNFLGVKNRAIYDLDPKKILGDEKRVFLDGIAQDKIAYIFSPNSSHVSYALDFLNRDIRFFVEKPIAISSFEIEQLDKAIMKAMQPSYFGDYYFFKALGLYSLMGIDTPFKERLQVEQDDNGDLRKAIDLEQTLLGKIRRIEASLLEGGEDRRRDD